jgi:hypothetical protein
MIYRAKSIAVTPAICHPEPVEGSLSFPRRSPFRPPLSTLARRFLADESGQIILGGTQDCHNCGCQGACQTPLNRGLHIVGWADGDVGQANPNCGIQSSSAPAWQGYFYGSVPASSTQCEYLAAFRTSACVYSLIDSCSGSNPASEGGKLLWSSPLGLCSNVQPTAVSGNPGAWQLQIVLAASGAGWGWTGYQDGADAAGTYVGAPDACVTGPSSFTVEIVETC